MRVKYLIDGHFHLLAVALFNGFRLYNFRYCKYRVNIFVDSCRFSGRFQIFHLTPLTVIEKISWKVCHQNGDSKDVVTLNGF